MLFFSQRILILNFPQNVRAQAQAKAHLLAIKKPEAKAASKTKRASKEEQNDLSAQASLMDYLTMVNASNLSSYKNLTCAMDVCKLEQRGEFIL